MTELEVWISGNDDLAHFFQNRNYNTWQSKEQNQHKFPLLHPSVTVEDWWAGEGFATPRVAMANRFKKKVIKLNVILQSPKDTEGYIKNRFEPQFIGNANFRGCPKIPRKIILKNELKLIQIREIDLVESRFEIRLFKETEILAEERTVANAMTQPDCPLTQGEITMDPPSQSSSRKL